MESFKAIELNRKRVLQFAIPAIIGAVIFLCPIAIAGKRGIVVGIILQLAANAVIDYTPYLAVLTMAVAAFAAVVFRLVRLPLIEQTPVLKKLACPGPIESVLRIVGAVLGIITLFELGPEFLWSEDTGGTMLELCANIIVWFIVASFFIPLLLDFGLLEFIGTFMAKIARPLFRLPGRSMIDLLTSFVGDQNLGVMITNDQYVSGYYTGREAAVIATCFSATGISYWYIISTILSVDNYFVPIYITIFVTGFISAAIMCRIWPLISIADTYYQGEKKSLENDKPEDMSLFQYALQLAVQKAATFQGFKAMAVRSVKFSADVVFCVVPIVMVIGTAGLLVATYTPVFDWLSLPFRYYLQLLQVPEAAAAAPATVAGFADMLIPALISTEIASERTRFIICVLSLLQIIYMSEVGPVMMMSKIPFKLWHLAAVFVVKTIVILPLIVVMAMLFQIPI